MQIAGLNTPQERREFLDKHWQQTHCFFPKAISNFSDPLGADDLAGLALSPEVESRIVEGQQLTTSLGPFTNERLENFPISNATLLVQSVDQYDSDVAKLLSAFDFIPAWRRDDVMVSFSTEGGGVGPHFDQYDVFLVQGEGQRHWRIGQHCDDDTAIDNSSGHKVLKDFEQVAEYTMSSGDVLYVPPGVAHWGISTSASLTYSIGFRSPSVADLTDYWFQQLSGTAIAQQRYRDDLPLPLTAEGRAYEKISVKSVEQLQTMFRQLADNPEAIASALGMFQTERCKTEEEHDSQSYHSPLEWEDISQRLQDGELIHKNLQTRVCYYQSQNNYLLFIDGNRWDIANCSEPWLEVLCSDASLGNEDVQAFCGTGLAPVESTATRVGNQQLLVLLLRQAVWTFD